MPEVEVHVNSESVLALRRRLLRALKDAGLSQVISESGIQITGQGFNLGEMSFKAARQTADQLDVLIYGPNLHEYELVTLAETSQANQVKLELQNVLSEQHSLPPGYAQAKLKVVK